MAYGRWLFAASIQRFAIGLQPSAIVLKRALRNLGVFGGLGG
jgi:hypothetical protein